MASLVNRSSTSQAIKNLGAERVKKFLQATSATSVFNLPFVAIENLGTERAKKFLQTTLDTNFIKILFSKPNCNTMQMGE